MEQSIDGREDRSGSEFVRNHNRCSQSSKLRNGIVWEMDLKPVGKARFVIPLFLDGPSLLDRDVEHVDVRLVITLWLDENA